MKIKNVCAVTLVAAALGAGLAAPALAAVTVTVGTPPPAVLVEPVPAVRHGHVWVPGYWRWNGNKHVWVKGHHVAARHGYRYVPDQWAEVNGRWVYHPGHWAR
ncbi:MAG: hypothetical protein ABI981_04535 [Betaproteobacteria bacterium]